MGRDQSNAYMAYKGYVVRVPHNPLVVSFDISRVEAKSTMNLLESFKIWQYIAMNEHVGEIQKHYYAKTASEYDSQHLSHGDEHYRALHYLHGIIQLNDFKRILDLGAGTGRAALFLKELHPEIEIISIEPVKELREIGIAKGLSPQEIIDGDIYSLEFEDSSFDLVSAFGVFHHLENPISALEEMKRVSRNSIFISDSNNFGQGKALSRFLKQALHFFGIWNLTVLVKTRGKKYQISQGDGLAYSFSLFGLTKLLHSVYSVYFLSTVPSRKNLFKTASHIAIYAQKK